MLSVVIEAKAGNEERLARTLGSLVGGAVSGAVREVIVIADDDPAGIAKVADHAGCRISGDLRSAVENAKSDWLLFLEPGARILDGWEESLLIHAARSSRPACLSRDSAGVWALAEFLRRNRTPFSHGLLIRRSEARPLLREGGKGLSGLRPQRLAARIVPAS